jgi:hypothetical protein
MVHLEAVSIVVPLFINIFHVFLKEFELGNVLKD